MKKLLSLIFALVMVLTAFPLDALAADQYQNNDVRHVVIHDPSVVKSQDGTYYSVGSHMGMGKSDDLVNWESLNFSLEGNNYLTTADKTWKDTLAVPLEWCMKFQRSQPDKYYNDERGNTFEYNCWANDIIYNETMGKYCLYGCCSVWGTTASAIWLCVSDNIEGPYTYVDTLIESGITSKKRFDKEHPQSDSNTDEEKAFIAEHSPVIYALDWNNSNIPALVDKNIMYAGQIDNTKFIGMPGYNWVTYDGFYNFWMTGYPNCIDPTAFTDANGDMWLVYGSYSGGCYVQKLDKSTGLVDYAFMKDYLLSDEKGEKDDIYYGKKISNTNSETEGTGEGPFIVYDKKYRYYYFFLTYGGLAGDGGYNIREYRSKSPLGPYVDKAGYSALDERNTGLKLAGNYKFSCQPTALLSGGHSSCLFDDDGSLYQVYHTRFKCDGGNGHQMRVHKMLRTVDGWAVMMPFEYQGEKDTQKITPEEIIGKYEFIDSNNMTQRKESWESPFSDIILPTQTVSFNYDGSITGAKDYSCSITNAHTQEMNVDGQWRILSDCEAFCEMRIGGVIYTCVFAYQKDESAQGKTVLTFSGAGKDNSTVWGVQSERYKAPATVTPKKITVRTPTGLKLVSKKKRTLIAKWKRISKATGYQLQVSTNSKFKKAKKYTLKGNKSVKKTVKKLKSKKKYYVRVRAYRKYKGKTYYSKWTKKKAIRIK